MFEHLLVTPGGGDFQGVLSGLYIGEKLVAAHFGMRSRRVLHWWFPAYDPELGKYSPGAQLLLELSRAAVYVPPIGAGTGPFTITPAYQAAMLELGKRRIALAGARLANLLNAALGSRP